MGAGRGVKVSINVTSNLLLICYLQRNLKREIHQFWFTTWPEPGQPEPLAFVKFILDARPRYDDTGTPVVVHCG